MQRGAGCKDSHAGSAAFGCGTPAKIFCSCPDNEETIICDYWGGVGGRRQYLEQKLF